MKTGSVVVVVLAGLLRTAGAQPAPPETAAIFQSSAEMGQLLHVASVTLRLQQLLGSVTDERRQAQMTELAATWMGRAPTEVERSYWLRSFDSSASSFFTMLDSAARRSGDPGRAVRALADARADLGYRRGASGNLARPLTDAISILDWGQPQPRYSGSFLGVPEEVDTLIATQLSAMQLPSPQKPQSGIAPAPSPFPGQIPGPTAGGPVSQAPPALPGQPPAPGPVSASGTLSLPGSPPSAQPASGNKKVSFNEILQAVLTGIQRSNAGQGQVGVGRPQGQVGVATPQGQPGLTFPGTTGGAVLPAASGGNLALGRPTRQSSRSQWSTATENGAVDGVHKANSWGFHTEDEANPWWEVDLQQVAALSEIRVYNRTDLPERARTLRAWVTADGSNWQPVYAHNGSVWGGDGSPLRIGANGIRARWVRLGLNEKTFFHLDEVEVYGVGSGGGVPVTMGTPGPGSGGGVTGQAPASGSWNAAQFLGEDAVTQGNWRARYGSQGAAMPGDTALPGWASISTSAAVYTWAGETNESRGMVKVNGASRTAACWYSDTTLSFDVNLADGQAHPLAVYLLDWDGWGGGRRVRVDIVDAATNSVLDSRAVAAFGNGRFLVWNVRGRVLLRVVNQNTGSNAVVSGVYLGTGTGGAVPQVTGGPAVTSVPAVTTTGGPTPGVSGNLALRRPTRISSKYTAATTGDGGVDGKREGYGFHTDLEANPWWEVDLQQVAALSEIRIYNRPDVPDRARTLGVWVTADGSNWQQIYSHNGSVWGADGRPLTIAANGARARWVRIGLTERNYLHLDEIEVYGVGAGSTGGVTSPTPAGANLQARGNLALGRPTRQSSRSQWSTATEGGAVDGVHKANSWGFHTEVEANPWWEVDLQQVAAIGEIRLYNRTDLAERARTLRAWVSADGSNWQPVYTHNGTAWGGDGQPLRIVLNGVVARWVRLGLNETSYFHLDEVEVWGAGGR